MRPLNQCVCMCVCGGGGGRSRCVCGVWGGEGWVSASILAATGHSRKQNPPPFTTKFPQIPTNSHKSPHPRPRPRPRSYDDLRELGSELAVKNAGKYRQQGKDYVVNDGDVIYFKFNVTSTGKK